MTNRDYPGWPPQENHDPRQETQRLSDQPPSSRRKGRPPRAHRNGRRIGIGLSAAVLVGVVAAVVSIATTGTHQTASSGSSAVGSARPGSGGTAPHGGTSTAKGKVISAAKLAERGGALSPPKNIQGSLTSWQSGAGGRELTAISNWLGQALQATGVKQYSSAKFACSKLAGNVVTAQAGPAIPDTAMQALYAKALTELAKGAAGCRSAISTKPTGDETVDTNVDSAMLHQALSELSAGAGDIFRATAEIQILGRQHH